MAPLDDKSPTNKEEEPDSPIVVALKELDDKVLELQKEFETKKNALRQARNEKQKPLLDKRAQVVIGKDAEEPKTGTPALPCFWLTAMKNHPELQDKVEKHDEAVLEYLQNIQVSELDAKDPDKGFKLEFIFVPNPYFSNSKLEVEFHYGPYSYYREEFDVQEVKGCEIQWKAGMDVTVEKVKKPAKAGKKKTAAKTTMEPRDSFFRGLFRSLKQGGDLPKDIDEEQLMLMTGGEDVDEDKFVEYLLEDAHEVASEFRDRIIPWAVRWYTGEAAPDEDDDDEDEEEEDSDDEDESDDESEEESPKGKKGKNSAKGNKKGSPKDGPKEECKQQ